MVDVQIRPMCLADLDEIIEIELASFTSPWNKESFEMELLENKFACYYIIGDKQNIYGYCGLWVIYESAQITNIAIHPKFRGNKYGEMLFAYALNKAREKGAQELSLEVRVSNIVAQKMYRKFGLKPVGVRKNYYTDNQEDALLMWVKL
jgi:[ribosomal protein S18]-alanine N-acetyltransferase